MVSPLNSSAMNPAVANILATGAALRTSNAPAASSVPPALPTPVLSGDSSKLMMDMLNLMAEVAKVAVQAKQSMARGAAGATPAVGAAGSAAPVAASAANGATAGRNGAGGGRPKIVQIDDFTTDNTGFNHGREVGNAILSSSGGNANLEQIDVSGGGSRSGKIANALRQVVQRVQNGEQVDAINISQQDFGNSADAQEVRQLIDQLSAMGVPVAVAAGNNGPGAVNQLASNSGFVVESTGANSGRGNVRAEGRTTSFATANLVGRLAAAHAQGLSLNQIRQNL